MRNLLFDLDGTLTDPVVGIVRCYQHALRELGAPPRSDHELQQFIGPPIRVVFQTLFQSEDPELIERAIRAYRERFSTIGLYENAVYAGIPEALAALRETGARLWVVTSKAHVYADRIIDHFALRPFFARVYGAELSGERSEKAELIAHVLREEGLEPTSACMIGDRKYDIEGARAHGVRSLGVLWGYGTREELERAGGTELVESTAGLVPAIARLTLS